MLLELESLGAQHGEEALRIADPGDRVHALPAEGRQRARGSAGVEPHGLARHQTHGERARPGRRARQRAVRGGPVRDHDIGARQGRERLAQRARRQQPAVAEAARSVDHHDLAGAPETQVLQPVVGQDHLHAARGERPRARHAVGGDEGRTGAVARQQQRLVADLAPVARPPAPRAARARAARSRATGSPP